MADEAYDGPYERKPPVRPADKVYSVLYDGPYERKPPVRPADKVYSVLDRLLPKSDPSQHRIASAVARYTRERSDVNAYPPVTAAVAAAEAGMRFILEQTVVNTGVSPKPIRLSAIIESITPQGQPEVAKHLTVLDRAFALLHAFSGAEAYYDKAIGNLLEHLRVASEEDVRRISEGAKAAATQAWNEVIEEQTKARIRAAHGSGGALGK